MKKKVIALSIIVFALITLYFVPIRWNISRTVPAQMIEDISNGSATETEIKVEGEYYFYIFRPDRFEGAMEITAFPETLGKNVDLEVKRNSTMSLIYRSWLGGELNSEALGFFQASFGMKRIIIVKLNSDGIINLNGKGTCVIISDNSGLEDAWALLNDLRITE